MGERRFFPYFCTQFLGAFNDNVYKNAIIMLATFHAAYQVEGQTELVVTMAGALFILPYLLFSAIAGQLADKYEKTGLIRTYKYSELAIVILGVIAFELENTWALLFIVFLLGSQSAFYSPVKYSILPERLKPDELLGGNGLVEAGTFLAILLGTITGTLVAPAESGILYTSVIVITVALLGVIASRFILIYVPANPGHVMKWNVYGQTLNMLRVIRHRKDVFIAVLGISWFWFAGSIFLTLFPIFAREFFHGNEEVVMLFLMSFTVGVAAGSISARMLLKNHISLRFTGKMLFLMSLTTALVAFVSPAQSLPVPESGQLIGAMAFLTETGNVIVLVALFLLAVASGCYAVPLFTVMQLETPVEMRARVIAGSNIMDSFFIIASSGFALGLMKSGLDVTGVFAAVAVLNLILALLFHKIKKSL